MERPGSGDDEVRRTNAGDVEVLQRQPEAGWMGGGLLALPQYADGAAAPQSGVDELHARAGYGCAQRQSVDGEPDGARVLREFPAKGAKLRRHDAGLHGRWIHGEVVWAGFLICGVANGQASFGRVIDDRQDRCFHLLGDELEALAREESRDCAGFHSAD